MLIEHTKLIAGKFKYPVTLSYDGKRIWVEFKFNRTLLEEIKSMEGSKWHGYDDENPRKIWSISNSPRNIFQLSYLKGDNPYTVYDLPLVEYESKRPLFDHQIEMVRHGLTRHYCIFACEMGTGKTLAAIEIMESSSFSDWIWVGPKSALYSVQLEMVIWKSKVKPTFLTYEELKKQISNWPSGKKAPQGVIFDESSRIKTPTAQRSQASMGLADGVRQDWGMKGFVIEMSGSPAPKAPTDWWHQCEVACPGFLKEGNLSKFKYRLCLIKMKESLAGGQYPELITWLDSETKCAECGQFEIVGKHSDFEIANGTGHIYKKSVNEVRLLYQRMSGLVLVKFKKDCLDLPEKQYKLIYCKPSPSTLRVAETIKQTASRAIEALTLLRELSDGFQYEEQPAGKTTCPSCKGTGKATEYFDPREPNSPVVAVAEGVELSEREVECPVCGGSKEIVRTVRGTIQVDTPKEQVLSDLLDEHEEVGRLVIYAGFQGSVDRCVQICLRAGWKVIRADGRGWWWSDLENPKSPIDLLKTFQFEKDTEQKVAFVGEPGAAGMGLNLTASPTVVYYSNDFNGENRIQSEDRIHRPGMDLNRGATVIDIIHLETDRLVLENIKKKRDLQNLSMGELNETMKHIGARVQ